MHERLMGKMKYRLGVWNFREAELLGRDMVWDFPTVMTERDPSDLAREFETMFGEVL
jgi:hypothetical protein